MEKSQQKNKWLGTFLNKFITRPTYQIPAQVRELVITSLFEEDTPYLEWGGGGGVVEVTTNKILLALKYYLN